MHVSLIVDHFSDYNPVFSDDFLQLINFKCGNWQSRVGNYFEFLIAPQVCVMKGLTPAPPTCSTISSSSSSFFWVRPRHSFFWVPPLQGSTHNNQPPWSQIRQLHFRKSLDLEYLVSPWIFLVVASEMMLCHLHITLFGKLLRFSRVHFSALLVGVFRRKRRLLQWLFLFFKTKEVTSPKLYKLRPLAATLVTSTAT